MACALVTMSQQQEPVAGSSTVLRATVRGRVQGVGFRMYVADAARRLGLGGYVKNQPDGSVYVLAVGERARLEELLALLWRGPSAARISGVEHDWADNNQEPVGAR